MAARIISVSPDRVKEGDTLTIVGDGFSPVFGDNGVNIGGVPAGTTSETDTTIVVDVPAGIPTDQFVAVIVVRKDTQEVSEDTFSVWSLPTLDELATTRLPGQVPGPREASNLAADVLDVPQSKDYERAAVLAEHQRDVVGAGELFASDGATVQGLPAGGGGATLHANAAHPLGLEWKHPERGITLGWGKEINTGGTNNGPMVANGDSAQTSSAAGDHGCPFDGDTAELWVLVQEASGGNTRDQVQLARNGGVVYDSGAGLGLGAGGLHKASPGIRVLEGDLLELRAFKAGGGFIMRLVGGLRLVERRVDVSDTVAAVDAVAVVKTGNQVGEPGADAYLQVTDTVSVELL